MSNNINGHNGYGHNERKRQITVQQEILISKQELKSLREADGSMYYMVNLNDIDNSALLDELKIRVKSDEISLDAIVSALS